jgi:hypothetical protein
LSTSVIKIFIRIVVKILVISKLGITMKSNHCKLPVFVFIVIPSLVITSILTTILIKILITDVENKCLLHQSAVISVRSNVFVRSEDGYNMSRNMSPM